MKVSQICWLLQGVSYFSSVVNGNASTQGVFPGVFRHRHMENGQAVLTCARSLQEQLENQVTVVDCLLMAIVVIVAVAVEDDYKWLLYIIVIVAVLMMISSYFELCSMYICQHCHWYRYHYDYHQMLIVVC